MTEYTTPAYLSQDEPDEKPMTQDEILMDEADLLAGLLGDAGSDREIPTRMIRIKRKGKVAYQFSVRALSPEENHACWKKATPIPKDRKKEVRTNTLMFQSLLIYTATVDEDRKKLWDNPKAQEGFGVLQGWEIIGKALHAGEYTAVIEIIDELGESSEDMSELGKN